MDHIHHFTYPPFHSVIVAPIYYRGMDLICKTWLACGLPAVILNLVRDDLRMMAPKPVAAKAGAMKDIAECTGLFMRLSRNRCRLLFDWVPVLYCLACIITTCRIYRTGSGNVNHFKACSEAM